MGNLANLGLVAVVVAWVIQYFNSSHKRHDLNPLFLIFYALGIAILVLDSFQKGSLIPTLLYFATFGLSVSLLLKTSKLMIFELNF